MKTCCITFKSEIGGWIGYDPIYRLYYLQQKLEDGPFINSFDHFSDEEREICGYEEIKPYKVYSRRKIKEWGIERILLNRLSLVLDFCPWCGGKLPLALDDDYTCALFMSWGNVWKNKYPWWCRNRWNEINLYGPKNPFPKGFPEEFKSDVWWKNRDLETKEGLKKWRKSFNEWLKQNPEAQTYCSFLEENI